ncbi:alpha/beta fold hydrolase [soil metagenome]
MNASAAASSATFVAPDGCPIAFTLHATPPQGGVVRPRIALIHSLALDRSVWDDVVPLLTPHADVLVYDCRGHGASGRPKMTFTPELFAADLAGLFDHLHWDAAAVAGCSMGGCVAQAFAGLYPARTRALGLIDTTAWYGPTAPADWRERAATAATGGLQALSAFQATRWVSDAFRETHPDLMRARLATFLANDIDCYQATCLMLGDADLRHYQPAMRMPVAVVVGDEDYAAPVAMAEQMQQAIAGATLSVLPGVRHLTPIECPGAIADEIHTLMKRVPAG